MSYTESIWRGLSSWEPCFMQQISIHHQHCGSQTHYHGPTVTKRRSQTHNLYMLIWFSCPSIVSRGLFGSFWKIWLGYTWVVPFLTVVSLKSFEWKTASSRIWFVFVMVQKPTICLWDCSLNFIKMIGSIGLDCICNKRRCGLPMLEPHFAYFTWQTGHSRPTSPERRS